MGRLGLAPAAFWSMTPRELASVLATASSGAPLDGAALARLAALYPDR